MAKQGIGTGSSPNDGTGDTLLTGAGKINDNFDEVYGVIGDGTSLFVGIVTQITAGTNVSISTAYGSVEVSAASTANLRADTLVVTGVSTLGIVTGATYYGDGSNLTGMANTSNVRTNSLNVSGVSTVASLNSTGVVTATSFVGSGVNLTGITTLIEAGDNITVTTNAGITTIASSAGSASTAEVRANTLVVTGVSTLGIVTGATYFGVGSNLTGITTLISAGNNITVTTNSGITTIASTASGGSTAEVRANTLVVTGVSTFSGDVELGSNSLDDITLNGDIASSITPDGDGTRFLGANGKAFANFYSQSADLGRGFSSGIGLTVSNDVYIGGDLEVGFAGSMRGNGSYVTDQRWSVSGANPNYTFTGIGITSGNRNNPYLYFQRGGVYEIENTTPDDHPLEIRESNGGAAWIAGVSTYRSSASSVTTRIEVPLNAPNTLVYQCTVHSGMYSTISVYPNALT